METFKKLNDGIVHSLKNIGKPRVDRDHDADDVNEIILPQNRGLSIVILTEKGGEPKEKGCVLFRMLTGKLLLSNPVESLI